VKSHQCGYKPYADEQDRSQIGVDLDQIITSAINMPPELIQLVGWDNWDHLLQTIYKEFSLHE
jgi:hypothetical protein